MLRESAEFEEDLEYADREQTLEQFLEQMHARQQGRQLESFFGKADEDNEGEADCAVARWEVYPEPEEELHADKNSDSIFTSRDDTDCQKKHADGEVAPTTRNMMTMQHQDKSDEVEYTIPTDQDAGGSANTDANINNKAQCGQHRSGGEVTNCGDASDSDEETVHGSGSDDDSGKNKDVDRENASGHDAKQFLGANSVEANKIIQV
jgi:hypothetical protein